jgi:hypothetical protein
VVIKLTLFSCLQAKELPTFKDNDFVNDGAVIMIGPEEKEKLMQTLQRDVEVGDGHDCHEWLIY